MKAENPTKQHSAKCPKLYGQECTCDGYHTFDELYRHRIALFIALCHQIANGENDGEWIWKAKHHADGTEYHGWFVMGIGKEKGKQISYHLPISKWDETDFATDLGRAPEFDGHTSDDVITRLKSL